MKAKCTLPLLCSAMRNEYKRVIYVKFRRGSSSCQNCASTVELFTKISKVHKDITLTQSNIFKLKQKQRKLEQAVKVIAEEQKETKHQSIAHKIYAENKKRADESHRSLRKLGPEMDLNLVPNISKLKKEQHQELEEAAKKPEGEKVVAEEEKETKHQRKAHKIYVENKKKADESHRSLRKLGPEMDLNLPLYNQPTDTELYHKNRRKYQSFKRNLLGVFQEGQ